MADPFMKDKGMVLYRWLWRLLPTLLLAWGSLGAATPPAEEHVLIQALIARVEKMDTMNFVRNGASHTAAEAAQHMQAKYAYFKEKIVTADDFIDRCASRSEMTGKPYMVKMGDAAPVEAGTFLKNELRALRKAQSP